MEFRWVAGIALWTLLSGPVFVKVQTFAPSARSRTVSSVPSQGKTNWHSILGDDKSHDGLSPRSKRR
jgi:hypothetical protein